MRRQEAQTSEEAKELSLIALVYFEMKDYQTALEFQNRANELAISLNDEWALGQYLGNLANCQNALGQVQETIAALETALQIALKYQRQRIAASITGNPDNCYLQLEDYPQALDYYLTALDLASQMQDWLNVANWHNNLGVVFARLGNKESARSHYTEARKLFAQFEIEHMLKAIDDNIELTLAD